MKKTIAIIAVAAMAGVATADLAFFQFKATSLADQGTPITAFGPLSGSALVQLVDLSAFVVGGQIDIANIPGALYSGDMGVTPFGSSSGSFGERDDALIGQMAYLLFDPNGGGIEVGDFIGISSGFAIADMAAPTDPAPTAPQLMEVGAVDANIQVVAIPEPATLGLMGIAGLGMFLARKKARR